MRVNVSPFRLGVSVLVLVSSIGAVSPGAAQENVLVERIDHVAILVPDPAAVDHLLRVFRDDLGFPQWFSPGRREHTGGDWGFYNTGVYVGNVFLEFVSFNPDSVGDGERFASRYYGFAFDSGLDHPEDELDARSIGRSAVDPFVMSAPDGAADTLFTNVVLRDLSSEDILVFFCRYHPKLFNSRWFDFPGLPAVGSNAAQHAYYETLSARQSSDVGSGKVREVVISVPEPETFKARYERLLFPLPQSEGALWQLPKGPALRLVTGDKYEVKRLVVEVESLPRAQAFLQRTHLSAVTSDGLLSLDSAVLGGVEVVFVGPEKGEGMR